MINDGSHIVKIAALELYATDKKEIVKVAGIVRRLSNWVKSILFSDYGKELKQFKSNTSSLQATLNNLNHNIDKLQSAIKDGDIDEYSEVYNTVVEQSGELYNQLKVVGQEGKGVKELLLRYRAEDMSSPDFNERIKSILPQGFDVPLNELLQKPLSDFKWYSNLDHNDIGIRQGEGVNAMEMMKKQIAISLKNNNVSKEEIDSILSLDNIKDLIENFKQSIITGNLIVVRPRTPSKQVQNATAGITVLEVTTSPFSVPGTDMLLQARVELTDLRTSISSKEKLSLKKTIEVTLLPRKKSIKLLQEILKTAQQSNMVPYKQTPLSQLELANALMKGYEIAFGSTPTAEVLAGGWSQIMMETSGKNMYNFNMGNIKASKSWIESGKLFSVKDTQEYTRSGKPYIHKGAEWRAFATAEEGAADYWKFIGKNYSNAMDWMAAGDVQSAGISLGLNNYYTASINHYAGIMGKLYDTFMTKIAPQIPNLTSNPQPPPGKKLDLRAWKDDYSKDDKDALSGKSSGSTSTDSGIISEIDALISKLYSTSENSMTNFVKQALVKQILPNTKVTVSVKSNTATLEEKLEFSKVASKILKDFSDTDCKIHSDGGNIEIVCSSYGTKQTVSDAILALCQSVSIGMNKYYKTANIRVDVKDGGTSKLAMVDNRLLAKNSKFLQLKRM